MLTTRLSPQSTVTVRPEPTFAETLERLWVERYTGPLMVHFQSGQPGVVEKLNPERIRMDTKRR